MHRHYDLATNTFVYCWHRCRHLTKPSFLIGSIVGITVSFPIEHFLYEKVWPFTLITKLLGL